MSTILEAERVWRKWLTLGRGGEKEGGLFFPTLSTNHYHLCPHSGVTFIIKSDCMTSLHSNLILTNYACSVGWTVKRLQNWLFDHSSSSTQFFFKFLFPSNAAQQFPQTLNILVSQNYWKQPHWIGLNEGSDFLIWPFVNSACGPLRKGAL